MKVMKENNDAIKNKVTPLAVLTTNRGVQAVREESAGSFIFHVKLLTIIKTSCHCHDNRDHGNTRIVTKA